MLHSRLIELDESKSWWCTVESIRHSLSHVSTGKITPLDIERISAFGETLKCIGMIDPIPNYSNSIDYTIKENHHICPPISIDRMQKEISKSNNFNKLQSEPSFKAKISTLSSTIDHFVNNNGNVDIGMRELSALRDVINTLCETAQAMRYEPQE
jgi:hypothetical protein